MRPVSRVALLLLFSIALGAQAAELAVLRNGYSIRHERREVLQDLTRLYTSARNYVDVPTSEILRFDPDDAPPSLPVAAPAPSLPQIVSQAGDKHLIDPELIASVIRAESDFNPRAVSPKGAQGLMQLMPGTASKLGVKDPFDPAANVDGGTHYLSDLLNLYNNDLVKALAAYNAGPHRVEQYHGVPPYRETRAYVARIINDFNRKKLAQRKAAAARSKTTAAGAKKSAGVLSGQAAAPHTQATALSTGSSR